MWLDISIGAPLVNWYKNIVRPTDIARVENPSQIGLLEQITVGRKLVIFKSVGEAERLLPDIAGQIDIIGYNLEHGPSNPIDEQANPVANAQRMRDLADQYNLTLAFGPDHDFALSDGVAIAPYVDIFVLQVQRAQTEPQTVYDFVLPLIPQLRAANPDLQVTVQVRTEGDVAAIADLIKSLKDNLDGVSILTSPETVPVAQALVAELRPETAASIEPAALVTELAPDMGETAVPDNQRKGPVGGVTILALLVGCGLAAFLIISGRRK